MANRLGIRGRTVELFVRFVDAAGNPTNADDVPQVEVSDSSSVVQQTLTDLGVILLEDTGLYKLEYEIPEDAPDGYWTDRWVAEIGGVEISNTFEFQVMTAGSMSVGEETVYAPGDDVPHNFTKEEAYGVNVLLKIMKKRLKNDGIRKVPDGQGGYIEEKCSVFSDSELICFLVNGLSEFNQIPHFTRYSFADEVIQTVFADVVIQGGIILALAAQALIEKGREFTITDNGVTYQPPQVAELLNNQYGQQLADYKEKVKYIKANMKPDPLGLGTFRVTAVSPNYLRLRHLRERQII